MGMALSCVCVCGWVFVFTSAPLVRVLALPHLALFTHEA